MPCRCGPLILAAMLLLSPGAAQAHRLEAEYIVLPDGKVQIESWFDRDGASPHGAQVQVFRQDGQLVTEGKLDARGLFVFSRSEPGPLKVVVSAGAGHRKELQIPAQELEATAAEVAPVPTDGPPREAEAVPRADRSPRTSLKDVLIGVTFLLAAAAFVMSWRNARQLRRLQGMEEGRR